MARPNWFIHKQRIMKAELLNNYWNLQICKVEGYKYINQEI